jgi:KDO2-lipid IV(A) lauroyltransferase
VARLIFKTSAERIPLLGKLGWLIEAGAMRLFWRHARSHGPEQASLMGQRLLSRLGPRLGKHRQVMDNLRHAFPELDETQREKLAGDMWSNFGAVLGEYPHLEEIRNGDGGSRIEVCYRDGARQIVAERTPAVYVTPHLANWEIAPITIVRENVPLSGIYSPQTNPYVDRLLQDMRAPIGAHLVTKQNAIRQLVREMRRGRSVGMLPDQRIDGGEPIPFFGIPAATTTSPAWLSLRMQCPLVPIEVERTGPARFRATFHTPLDTGAPGGDDRQRITAITRALNSLFEEWIRKHPQHWQCTKRRWPKQVSQADETTPATGEAPWS